MKSITGFTIITTTFIFSCNQVPNEEVKDANQNLKEAKHELKEARINENQASKAKNTDEWNFFKKECDSAISSMEDDLKKAKVKLANTNKKYAQKLNADYVKANNELASLKDKLHQKNAAFESNVGKFDNRVYQKNESFKREFKHDMEALGRSYKNLFQDNVN